MAIPRTLGCDTREVFGQAAARDVTHRVHIMLERDSRGLYVDSRGAEQGFTESSPRLERIV